MRNCKHREKERVKASLSLASSLCTVTINMLTRCQNYGRRELTKPGRVTEPVLRALSLLGCVSIIERRISEPRYICRENIIRAVCIDL